MAELTDNFRKDAMIESCVSYAKQEVLNFRNRIVDWSRDGLAPIYPTAYSLSVEKGNIASFMVHAWPRVLITCMHTSVHATRFAPPFIFNVARCNFRRSARGCAINYLEGYRVGRERDIVIILGVIIIFRGIDIEKTRYDSLPIKNSKVYLSSQTCPSSKTFFVCRIIF